MDIADVKDVSIFVEQLGSQFRIDVGAEQSVTAKLVEADPLGVSDGNSQPELREPFSLLFEVGESIQLSQGTYPVYHKKLGSFSLFLVPVGPAQLESVFN